MSRFAKNQKIFKFGKSWKFPEEYISEKKRPQPSKKHLCRSWRLENMVPPQNTQIQNTQSPKIPKAKIPKVRNTQGQNTQCPKIRKAKIPKVETTIPIK